MTLWLAALILAHAWWVAALSPTAERVQVAVTTTSGELYQSAYSVWFDPAGTGTGTGGGVGGHLALAIGPLGIEADERGLWAAHRLDPTTVAMLTDQPVRSFEVLGDYLPPTSTPTAALARSRPDSPWVPLPGVGEVKWSSATIIMRGQLPVGVRLKGTSHAGGLEAVVRDHRLRSITLWPTSPNQRTDAIAKIELTMTHDDVGERVMVNRDAARVTSLFALRPLGPAFTVGQRLPAGLKLTDSDGVARYENLPWEDGADSRLVVLVRTAGVDEQTAMLRKLDDTLVFVQQDLDAIAAANNSQSVRFTSIALLDAPGATDAVDRVNAAIASLKATRRWRGVYAIKDQRRLIERLDPGPGSSPMVGVVLSKEGVIRALVPIVGRDGEGVGEPSDRASLVASLKTNSARGR